MALGNMKELDSLVELDHVRAFQILAWVPPAHVSNQCGRSLQKGVAVTPELIVLLLLKLNHLKMVHLCPFEKLSPPSGL